MTKVNLNGEETKIEMTEEEFEKVKDLLGREPSITEVGALDVIFQLFFLNDRK
jgi:phosphoribosylformylglycinamidine (FGAM) synthase-like enzyme